MDWQKVKYPKAKTMGLKRRKPLSLPIQQQKQMKLFGIRMHLMDKFSEYPTTLTAPARDARAIVPNDTVDLPELPRAIYIGQTGNVSARLASGATIMFLNAQAGSCLPVRVRGINATGTTALGIVSLW
jgi:hypothetical protein